MKKRILLMATLCLCVAALCACQSNQPSPPWSVVSNNPAQNTQNLTTPAPVETPVPDDNMPDFDDGTYDPSSEEGGEDDFYIPEPEVTAAPTMRSEYAGATPVVIDPIDKPTPTPLPPLTFTYQTYDATNLHLSFEAPAGWVASSPSSDTFVLTNPNPSADYAASITIRAVQVTGSYGANELRTEINNLLDTIGESGYDRFSPSRTAERTLLDAAGVYANYTGTLSTGAKTAGRVHATCVSRTLYTVHVSYPQGYTDTYKDQVYDKLRDTIKITQ